MLMYISTFAPGSKTRMWYFLSRYDEIVYYTPREKKTWTVHSSCELTPEPKASVANTCCGLANFTPVERILTIFPHIKAEDVIFLFRSRAGMKYFRLAVRK